MTTQNLAFTAGETKALPQGNFFKINSATSKVSCVFFNKNETEIGRADFKQGDSINSDDGFAKVEVTSATAQAVEIHTLPFIMNSSNLVGNVSAVTKMQNDSNLGRRFYASIAGSSTGGAEHQIFNPNNSGVNLSINKIRASTNAAVETRVTLLTTNAAVAGNDLLTTFSMRNYEQANLLSVAETRILDNSSGFGYRNFYTIPYAAGNREGNWYDNFANLSYGEIDLENELVITEGYGLSCFFNVAGQYNSLIVEYEEVDNV